MNEPNKNRLIAIIFVILLAVVGWFAYDHYHKTVTPKQSSTAKSNVCKTNPDPASTATVNTTAPLAHASVTSPLTVSGQIEAFEAVFQMTIYDSTGSVIATKTGNSQQGQVLSPFNESLPFTVTTSTPACLWVFQYSAKDGSPSKIQQIPITLLP